MIKAIFFDFDGVLTTDSSGSDTMCHNIATISGIPFPKVRESYDNHVADLVLGRKRYSEVWNEFCENLGQEVDVGILKDVYAKIPLNTKMFDLVRKLYEKNILGIITDNLEDRLEALTRQYALDELFSTRVCSAAVGSGKSEQQIFRVALNHAGVKANESIFIDNKENNLVAAKEIGFGTYYHNDEKNDVEALKTWLMEQGVEI